MCSNPPEGAAARIVAAVAVVLVLRARYTGPPEGFAARRAAVAATGSSEAGAARRPS